MCSCGVHSLSRGDLRRMGKTGPDPAPAIVRKPHTHEATGVTVQLPEGTGYGWDHMPGDLWERGLVPSALIEEGGGLIQEGRHAVVIDQPSPLADLVASARLFTAQPLAEDLAPEDYVRAFLEPFGADIGRAVLWEDPAGMRVPISDQFFRDRLGTWKIGKRGRGRFTPLMAETLMDPDEIWLGVAAKPDPVRPDMQELLVDRRYVRVDPALGILSVMEIGRKWWEPVTMFVPDREGRPNLSALNARRGGKLIWKRK
ncbi:PBECR2 nuclease fold domain-containing protein [Paracoccus angustae]|uniref:PBECR2 nuclease fold domain-containing protein n=1 Tax=Paracoccus angustae TaxID=1671480 RepID=A0ABV7U1V5_9RHOB